MIGQVVGNYKITTKIGEGGMGSVYKGVDLMLEREVAIKVLKPELAGQPEIVERFRSEAVTLARLNHPRIATLYSFVRHGDEFLMVMEFVPGQTLGDVIGTHGAIHWNDAVPIFCQALEGIDHAHSMGIIHRDVKPANIMVTGSGAVKVMDFGIARVLGSARMTRAGHLIGTIEYMSPEQVKGQNTDARSDIYSSGIVLYELLTGRVPFSNDSEFDLMRSQIEDIPQSPKFFARSIPDSIAQSILRALEKDPQNRFETAGQFRAALINSGLGMNTQLDYSGQTIAPRNSGSHLATPGPPATRIAGSQEFPLQPAEGEVKGTRIAMSGETFSQTQGGAVGFDPRAFQGAGVAPETSFSDRARQTSINMNWKLFAGAGGALVLLIIGAITMFFVLSKSPDSENSKANKNVAVSATPLTNPAQNNPGAGPNPAPAPNDAASMGIKVTPDDPSKSNSSANTSKNSSGSDDDTSGKNKRESTTRTSRTDTGRQRSDDSGSKRSKALKALDQ